MNKIPEGRKEISLEELEKLQRAGNINVPDIQVEGICTIFDKDGNVKGQARVCSVEEAETEHRNKLEN
jgi:hypothetical protein